MMCVLLLIDYGMCMLLLIGTGSYNSVESVQSSAPPLQSSTPKPLASTHYLNTKRILNMYMYILGSSSCLSPPQSPPPHSSFHQTTPPSPHPHNPLSLSQVTSHYTSSVHGMYWEYITFVDNRPTNI